MGSRRTQVHGSQSRFGSAERTADKRDPLKILSNPRCKSPSTDCLGRIEVRLTGLEMNSLIVTVTNDLVRQPPKSGSTEVPFAGCRIKETSFNFSLSGVLKFTQTPNRGRYGVPLLNSATA